MTEAYKLVDGVEVPLTEDDLAQMAADAAAVPEWQWGLVRVERNAKLAATDWWVTKASETGGFISPEQHAYRQALRDVTDQPDPFNIVWPVAPSEGA